MQALQPVLPKLIAICEIEIAAVYWASNSHFDASNSGYRRASKNDL
jgi:hypothetical protein